MPDAIRLGGDREPVAVAIQFGSQIVLFLAENDRASFTAEVLDERFHARRAFADRRDFIWRNEAYPEFLRGLTPRV